MPDPNPVHMRATTGRFLLVCRTLASSVYRWTDNPSDVTCLQCRRGM
jgi:hypothetical protein